MAATCIDWSHWLVMFHPRMSKECHYKISHKFLSISGLTGFYLLQSRGKRRSNDSNIQSLTTSLKTQAPMCQHKFDLFVQHVFLNFYL